MNHFFRKFVFCFLFLFALSCVCFSQNSEWRPLTPADLQPDKPGIETSAPAEALFWEEKVEQGLGGTVDEVYENGRLLYPASAYAPIKETFDRVALADSAVVALKRN